MSKVPEPTHTVFTVSPKKALHRGLQLHADTHVGGCPSHEFVSNWGMNTIMCSIPKVHLVWVDLPQDIPTPIQSLWQALTNMVTAARKLDIPVVIIAKRSKVTKACGDPKHSEMQEPIYFPTRDIVSVPMEYGFTVALFIGKSGALINS